MRHLETLCGSHGGLKDSTSAKSAQTVATLLECPSRLECPYVFIFFFQFIYRGQLHLYY